MDTVKVSSQVRTIACRLYRTPVQYNTYSSVIYIPFCKLKARLREIRKSKRRTNSSKGLVQSNSAHKLSTLSENMNIVRIGAKALESTIESTRNSIRETLS
jgi:hypothetical protein